MMAPFEALLALPPAIIRALGWFAKEVTGRRSARRRSKISWLARSFVKLARSKARVVINACEVDEHALAVNGRVESRPTSQCPTIP